MVWADAGTGGVLGIFKGLERLERRIKVEILVRPSPHRCYGSSKLAEFRRSCGGRRNWCYSWVSLCCHGGSMTSPWLQRARVSPCRPPLRWNRLDRWNWQYFGRGPWKASWPWAMGGLKCYYESVGWNWPCCGFRKQINYLIIVIYLSSYNLLSFYPHYVFYIWYAAPSVRP